MTAPAVGGHGVAELGAFDPHHRRVGSWNDDGICANFVVVLLEDRTPRAQVRVREHPEENLAVIAGIGVLRDFEPLPLVEVGWSDAPPLVDRSVCEVLGGDGAGGLAATL